MRYIKTYQLFESNVSNDIITKDEFPTEDDLKDFFFDLIDELPYCDLKISMSGYVSFSSEFIYGFDTKGIKRQMLHDMSLGDDWFNKEADISNPNVPKNFSIPVRDTWKNILPPIDSPKANYPIYINLDEDFSINSKDDLMKAIKRGDVDEFEYKFYENIINGTIPAYPFIELERIYFDVDDKDKLNILNNSLRRLYEATGFRPVGNFHTEDFVDEDSGEVVNLYIANIKLFKVTDVEYKSLIKSKVVVDNPDNEQNKEMTKKFL